MKIALFSDIHANLPAFEAMLEDLDSRKPDAIYCLGDLIGYHIWPNEVIAEIRKRGIATIAGNHDLKVIGLVTTQQNTKEASKKYAYHLVSEENRVYMTSLPSHIRLEYQTEGETRSLLLVHGSPRFVDEYILGDSNERFINQIMEESSADILCVGHSHKPFHYKLTNGNRVHQVINIGSVGKPKDGDPRGCYVMLNLEASFSEIQVEFIRFNYDVERSASAIENSLLPVELAERLRKAY